MLEIGTKAPDFELPDQNGEMHKLSCHDHLLADRKIKCHHAHNALRIDLFVIALDVDRALVAARKLY